MGEILSSDEDNVGRGVAGKGDVGEGGADKDSDEGGVDDENIELYPNFCFIQIFKYAYFGKYFRTDFGLFN